MRIIAKEKVEGQLLETLVILVEEYERKKRWEIPIPENPLDVIKIRMDD